jgi:hypothetical protein
LKEIREVLSDAKKEYVVIKDEGIAQMTDEANKNKKEIAMDTIAKLTAAEKKANDRVEGKAEKRKSGMATFNCGGRTVSSKIKKKAKTFYKVHMIDSSFDAPQADELKNKLCDLIQNVAQRNLKKLHHSKKYAKQL